LGVKLKILDEDRESFVLKGFEFTKDAISWLLLNDFLPIDEEEKTWKHLYNNKIITIPYN